MTDIDREVAEKVMGWVLYKVTVKDLTTVKPLSNEWCVPDEKTKGMVGEVIAYEDNFHPSTNISDAWLVVERMRELGYGLWLAGEETKGFGFHCKFHDGDKTVDADADTATFAIVLAALKCVENEKALA